MIELAAVAGPRFELRLVAAAAGLDRAALTEAVVHAARDGIIEELPEAVPTCRFTHELVRRAVYDPIPRVRLRQLHLLVGEALEEVYAPDLARVLPELAHHFTIAAPLAGAERAVDYNLRAAEAATASVAYREAAARLATALELGISDPRVRAGVQAELGHLYYEGGRLAESDALLTASLDAAISLGERALATRALVQRTNQRLASDPLVSSAEIVPIAEEAVRTLEQLDDPLGLAMAEHLLAHVLSREGRRVESVAALERALALAEAAGDQVIRRHVNGRFCRGFVEGPTPAAEGIGLLEKFRSSHRDDPILDAGICACLAAVLAMAGRFEEAHEHILASSPLLDQAGQTDFSLQGRWTIADAMECTGDLAGTEQQLWGCSSASEMREAPDRKRERFGWPLTSRSCSAIRAAGTRPPPTSTTARRSTEPSRSRARSTPGTALPPGVGWRRSGGNSTKRSNSSARRSRSLIVVTG